MLGAKESTAPADVWMSATLCGMSPVASVVTVSTPFRFAPGGELAGIGCGMTSMVAVPMAGTV